MNKEETEEIRAVAIPQYKLRKIKENWLKIYTAIIEHGKVQLRYNIIQKCVEFKASTKAVADCKIALNGEVENMSINKLYLERCVLFINAVLDGFKVEDATALLKYKDVFCEKFEIEEVRKMKQNHLTRAIGRVIGRQGRTKEAIENFSQVKFNLINNTVFMLGTTTSITMAKDAICRLIQGSEPTSIFNRLKIKSTKQKEKYGCLQTIYDDLRDDIN